MNDDELRALFAQDEEPEQQPFVADLLRQLAVEQQSDLWLRRALLTVALLAVVVTAPWLIRASTWMSERFDVILGALTDWLISPIGGVCVGAAVAGLLVFRQLRRV